MAVKEIMFKEDSELQEIVEGMKKKIARLSNSSNIKFVGLEFHFLVDDETQVKLGIFAEGYDPKEFEEGDSDVD